MLLGMRVPRRLLGDGRVHKGEALISEAKYIMSSSWRWFRRGLRLRGSMYYLGGRIIDLKYELLDFSIEVKWN